HTITIEGEKIEREEIPITFDNDWMMVTHEISAQSAKRRLLVITDPPGATVEVNGIQQSEQTPVMIEVTIEQEHTIKLTKDGYQEKELTVKEEDKGDPKRIEMRLEANKAPNPPILIAPTGNQEDSISELKWFCSDEEGDGVGYEIYFGERGQNLSLLGKIDTNQETEGSYRVTNLKPNTQYDWQIIARDDWNQTESAIWTFKTKERTTRKIKIETEPSLAGVYIDGKYKGISPITVEMDEGSYLIEARLDGFVSNSQTKIIDAQTQEPPELETITMVLEKASGNIDITTHPDHAQIYLNGVFKGTSPITVEKLEVGTYTIKAIKSGYEEREETTNVEKGVTKELAMRLTEKKEEATQSEKQAAEIGYLKIEGNIGKTYFIDGENKGWIIPVEIKLPIGKHTIEIEGKGQTEIEIKKDTTTIIDNKTEFRKVFDYIEEKEEAPQTSNQKKALYEIITNPAGVSVYINGIYKGVTPISLQMAAGCYILKLSYKDYDRNNILIYEQEYERRICVEAGEDYLLAETFETTPGPL
ncbi:MAG TPA: PEGA domain-containing protein, partial [Thermotogota bacterium]|nr:PEGA domain-containing protein [Thermotogota bacterium]